MHDRMNGDGALSPLLREATRQLQRGPEPSDVWRQRVIHAVADSARKAGDEPRRVWSFRPVTVVAAAVACAMLGGAAMYIVTRVASPGPTTVAASAVVAQGPLSSVRFVLAAPRATRVALVGDFNGWDPALLPMRRATDGTWVIEVPLAPGRYTYSFVVDGALSPDPSAPRATEDDFGSPSSVVLVKGS